MYSPTNVCFCVSLQRVEKTSYGFSFVNIEVESIIIQVASPRWVIFLCYGDDRTGMNFEIRQDAIGRLYLPMNTEQRSRWDPR
jgi:hypothetical protein